MSEQDQGPTESVLRRIEGFAKDHHDSGYEQGYVDSYEKTQKLLARRSFAWLLVGLLVGSVIAWQVTAYSLDAGDAAGAREPVDPAEVGATPGLELTNAANFARSYTVGIVAETRSRFGIQRQAGSGFFYGDDGYILTNAHVVEAYAKNPEFGTLVVSWRDEVYSARLVGIDPKDRDVALLRIKTKGVRGAKLLPEGEHVQIAEQVISVGSPLGLEYSVTGGIISHTARRGIDKSGVAFLQTDCAINQGNSGGPLVNRQGSVVGMNTKIASRTGDSAGIGFAIPVDDLRSVADDLIARDNGQSSDIESEGLSSEAAYLGIYVERAPNGEGLLVTEVVKGSAAENAGIKAKDVLIAINGLKIFGANDLRREITSQYKPGDKIKLNLMREGSLINLDVTLGGIRLQGR